MNAPFLCERMLLALSLHDELVSSLVVSCFVAQSRHTPRRHRVIAFHAAFTSAVRMIDRVHDHATNRWPNPHMAHTASLSNRDVFVIKIAHLSDGCHAIYIH